MTNIKILDSSLWSINQISFKCTHDVNYFIEIFTMKRFDSANSLYLVFNNVDAYIEESNENKYLIFAFTDKNKEALDNYAEPWKEIKDQIEIISGNKPTKYGKDFIKIKFLPDDNLPLGKMLNIPVCIISVRSVFQENNNYYSQVHLHECLCEYEYKDEDDSYSIV